jgi:hypothetical protein
MNNIKKKFSFKKISLWITGSIFIVIVLSGIYVYYNFNRLLSDALMKSFNSSTISDVYELKFHNLNVNPLLGNIVVKDVEILPREKPLKEYPYINSSFQLKTRKIELIHVEIMTLLKENKLKLERIRIADPALKFLISDAIPTFIPFNQTKKDSIADPQKNKNNISGFFLKEFNLENASFHVLNTAKQRDISVSRLNISLNDLLMDQTPGKDIISYSHIKLSIGEVSGSLKNEALKYLNLKNYRLSVDSLKIQKSMDTLIYHFYDFNLGMGDLDIQTADSIFHLTMQAFNLNYRDSVLNIKNLSFKPNISDSELQKRFKFQNTQFSGSIAAVSVTGINYDTLIYKKKLFIDRISLDSIKAAIFKDKTKPFDSTRFPEYLGQSIKSIALPLLIKEVKATNIDLVNTERKPDGSFAKANINRGTASVSNITNFETKKVLLLKADAWLENKAHFKLNLGFDYLKPQFSIDAKFEKFNLPDLNDLIKSYTPANILNGTADEISFSGNAFETNANGTMKFLYHDLKIDLELKEQAKWKSSVLAFAANTVVASDNPGSESMVPKIVKYHVERDMHKSFVNITIKSALAGLKETIIMSKENRKAFKAAKKEALQKAKEESKK